MNTLKSLIYLVVSLALFKTTVSQLHDSADGRQYYIESAYRYNWFKANHECGRRNLRLVEIDSHVQNNALVALLKSLYGSPKKFWIGANDEFVENEGRERDFFWLGSGRILTFSYWNSNSPSNYQSNEHCVHTSSSDPNYRWNDGDCNTKMGFICELM